MINYKSGLYKSGKWGAFTWELVFGNVAGVEILGRQVFSQALKRGGVAGIVSGSLDFVFELARGGSIADALKQASLTGITNAVSYGLPASGVKIRLSIAAATLTNLMLQESITEKMEVGQALFSAVPPSVGGAFMYSIDITKIPYVGGVVTGFVTAPANLAASIFFSENSAGK